MDEDLPAPRSMVNAMQSASSGDRIPLHTRQVSYRVFARADGFFDVEGTLLDTKEFLFDRPNLAPLAPGDPVHHMAVTVTVDETLRIVGISGQMHTVPLDECQLARAPLARLIGEQLGRGWRRTLETAMGGTSGCTHLRELMANLATAAIQGIPGYRDQQRRRQGLPNLRADAAPHYVDGCLTWRRDGPAVQRLLPQFATSSVSAKVKP